MSSAGRGEQRELTDYLALLWRRWPWVLVAVVICGLLAFLYSSSRPLTYEATARVLLGTTAAQEAVASRVDINTDVASRDLVNEINLAESDAVRLEVSRRLNTTVDELPETSITADVDSDILNFEFRQTTAARASQVANSWAEAYVDLKRDMAQASIDEVIRQLDVELADLRQERSDIRAQLEVLEDELVSTTDPTRRAALQLRVDREASAISGDLDLVEAQTAATVENLSRLKLTSELAGAAQIFQVASPPKEPVNAPVSRDVAIGTVLGFLLGGGLAIARDTLDGSVRLKEDVEQLGVTVLGRVPRAPKKLARSGLATISQTMPGSTYADAYQKVRGAVRFVSIDRDVKSILVTSPHEGDGKTTLSVNLAMAYAGVGKRVVLIDLDMRRPSIQDYFSAPAVPGFSDALENNLSFDELAVSAEGLSSTLRVLTAGTCPPDPAAFLATPALSAAIERLSSVADLIVLDAPPTLPVADALSVAPVVDGVIVVVSAGKTTVDDLTETVQSLRRAGGDILGVVLNRTERQKEGSYGQVGATNRPVDAPGVSTVYPSELHPRSASSSSNLMPPVVDLGRLPPPDDVPPIVVRSVSDRDNGVFDTGSEQTDRSDLGPEAGDGDSPLSSMISPTRPPTEVNGHHAGNGDGFVVQDLEENGHAEVGSLGVFGAEMGPKYDDDDVDSDDDHMDADPDDGPVVVDVDDTTAEDGEDDVEAEDFVDGSATATREIRRSEIDRLLDDLF